MLQTTVGAVKAALHSARPAPALVERFIERLNASDLPAMLELMLDTASIETLGGLLEVGRQQFERKGSWLWQSVHVHPDLPEKLRPKKWETEPATLFGERVMLSFSTETGARLLQSVTRFEEVDERISRIRAYYLCPETMQEVGERLKLSVGHIPHRIPNLMTVRAGAER